MSEASRPTALGELLRAYLERSGIGARVEEAHAVADWTDRVGPAIAAVTTPLRVSHGTLIVAVRSSAWLMELRLMERQILAQVNAQRGRGRIRRIQFVMQDGD
jgi:predicted nucleic acid-binding Zn ribbon protein